MEYVIQTTYNQGKKSKFLYWSEHNYGFVEVGKATTYTDKEIADLIAGKHNAIVVPLNESNNL